LRAFSEDDDEEEPEDDDSPETNSMSKKLNMAEKFRQVMN